MRRASALVLLVALSLTAWAVWAARESGSITPSPSSVSDEPRVVARERGSFVVPVSTLGKQQSSAYQARLFAAEDGVVLLTPTGFTFFRDGAAAEPHSIALGPVAVRQGGSIVFWRAGSLRQVSLAGAEERLLTALARAPRYLLASDSRLAWIGSDPGTGASLQTLSGGHVRAVHETEERVCASVLREATVYWILQAADGSWRIESIGLDGQHRKQTAARGGRPPALLALGPDGVYFYDGPERGVRRLSFELDREDAVLKDVICSPLVVSNRTVCAHVGGLFDIPQSGRTPRILAPERDGPITALAATDERVFWIAESGAEQLVLRSLPLPGL